MPRLIMVILLTGLLTFVMSSIYLRIRHLRSSPGSSFWDDGTRWRNLMEPSPVTVRVNTSRLVTDIVALPFALLIVIGGFFIYDLFTP